MELVTRIIFEGRPFIIVKGRRGYYGIEQSLIGEDGRMSRKLDPLKDNLRDTLAGCINAVEIRVRVEKLLESGKTPEEAALQVILG